VKAVPRLLGAAGEIRKATDSPLFPAELVAVDRAADDARATLGKDAYQTAFAEGASLTIEAAASLALSLGP